MGRIWPGCLEKGDALMLVLKYSKMVQRHFHC